MSGAPAWRAMVPSLMDELDALLRHLATLAFLRWTKMRTVAEPDFLICHSSVLDRQPATASVQVISP